MDFSVIYQALQYSVGSTQQDIKMAETFLAEARFEQGFIQNLLLIGCDEKANIYVRLAALVHLRATVRKLWRKRENGICELDKETLKASILDGLVKCTESTKFYKQLEDTIRYIAETEFPDTWKNIFPDLLAKLSNPSDYSNLLGALVALKALVKNHQFLNGKDRIPLEYMVEDTFTILSDLVKSLLNTHNEQTERLLQIIVKIFYFANCTQIPKFLMDEERIKEWLFNIQGIMERPLPQDMQTPTTNERTLEKWEKSPAWSNKKWCAKIMNKFVSKYTNKVTIKDENKGFPELFLSTYANYFLEAFLKLLYNFRASYLQPKTRFFSLKYIINSLNHPDLHNTISLNLETIIYDIIIPALQLTTQDEEDWVQNPLEFIRRDDEHIDLSNSPKLAAQSLLDKLADKKLFEGNGGELILPRLFEFSAQALIHSQDIRLNVTVDLKMKEVILYVLGILRGLILRSQEYTQKITALFEQYIIPEFKNVQGPLKFRLCWLLGIYSCLNFENHDDILTITEGLYNSLCEEALPVRVKAGISLDAIFDIEQAQIFIKPYLDKILLSYIGLIDQIDNEKLTMAFEGIITKFADYIYPFAVDLVKYLSESFQKADQEAIQSNDATEMGEKEAIAGGFLSSIVRIFNDNIPKETVKELEKILLPTLLYIFKNQNSNNIELGLKLLNLLLNYTEELSEDLWGFFFIINYLIVGYPNENQQEGGGNNVSLPAESGGFRLLEAIGSNGRGEEHVAGIVPCVQKYIQKDKAGVIFNAKDPCYNLTYIELLFNSIEKVYEICYDSENDTDMVLITTIYIAIVENEQQLSENVLTYILEKAIVNIPHVKSIAQEKIIIQIICACLWVNAGLTLQYLEHKNATELIFTRWMLRMPDFKHSFEFKRVLIGFASILRVNFAQLPQLLLTSMKGLLSQMISLTAVINEMREKKLMNFDIFNLKAFSWEHTNRNDQQGITQLLEKDKPSQDGDGEDYEEEEPDIYDYELEGFLDEKDQYTSPLIQTCEILYFKTSLELLKEHQNEVFVELMSNMVNQDELVTLQNYFEKAENYAQQHN